MKIQKIHKIHEIHENSENWWKFIKFFEKILKGFKKKFTITKQLYLYDINLK